MEDHNNSYYYTNDTWDDHNNYSDIIFLDYIIVSFGVPLCAVAVYVLYSLVRHDRAPAPVYIINLLISDIIQICCIIATIWPLHDLFELEIFFLCLYICCLFASVAFMVCIALERYLLVAWPLWYHFKRPTRISVVVSALVWIFCLAVFVVPFFVNFFHFSGLVSTIYGILFLLPIPILASVCGCKLNCRKSSISNM